MFGRVLILSPHMDDEILGCAGLIARCFPQDLHIRYYNRHHTDVPDEIYQAENKALQVKLGCKMSFADRYDVNQLEEIAITYHITDIENTVNRWKPDTLLVPFADYNQDHRRIYEAALTATRPHDKNFLVKNVLVYEQPCTDQVIRNESHFIPQVFLPISIEWKLGLYQIYQSQIRGHRSLDHVKTLAELRGQQCGEPFAEAYMVKREKL